jgi:hypothetical protein
MREWIAAIVVAVLVAGCSSTYHPLTPSASVTTTTVGWEQWFKIDWSVEPEDATHRRVDGYISNKYGRAATNVQVLVQALDANGNVIGQKIVPVGGTIGPFSRMYFDVRHVPAAENYRVSLWAFDFIEAPSRRFP